jgi:polyhydroxyalkanoate synthesis regulator phasin
MRLLICVALGALVLTGCGGPSTVEREKLAATQAVIDERVKAGTMTEAEGRLAIAKVKAEMDAERRRNYAIMTSGDGPATYQPVGGGTVVKY